MHYKNPQLRHCFHQIITLMIFIFLPACTSAQLQPTQGASNPAVPQTSAVIQSLLPETVSSTPAQTNSTSTIPADINSHPSITPTNHSPVLTSTGLPNTPTPLPPDYWMSLPITPTVSHTAHEIFQRGMELGRDPRAFSKIGDCKSI